MKCPKKWKIKLPYNPVISLEVIYPKECEAGFWREICTLMFIIAICMRKAIPLCAWWSQWNQVRDQNIFEREKQVFGN